MKFIKFNYILFLFLFAYSNTYSAHVFFSGNSKQFIKVDQDKKYISLKACEVADLDAEKDQIRCQKLFTTTKKDFKLTRYCLNTKYGLNALNIAGATAIAYFSLKAEETGAKIGGVTGAGALTQQSLEAINQTKNKKKIFNSDNESGINNKVTSMTFDDYVDIAKKSIADSLANCDVDPIEAFDSTKFYITLSQEEILMLKKNLHQKNSSDCEVCDTKLEP